MGEGRSVLKHVSTRGCKRLARCFTNATAEKSEAGWDQMLEKLCATHAKRLADAGPITIVSIGGDSFPIQWPVTLRFPSTA